MAEHRESWPSDPYWDPNADYESDADWDGNEWTGGGSGTGDWGNGYWDDDDWDDEWGGGWDDEQDWTPAPPVDPAPTPTPDAPGSGDAPGWDDDDDYDAPPSEPAPDYNKVARLAKDGRRAIAPRKAPRLVRSAIRAANRLTRKPYVWGGGHGSFIARGYDCSGAVSYVLHAINKLNSPLVSGALASWGKRGKGKWISVYANKGHVYMVVAGLRFDTSGRGESGPRWRPEPRPNSGFRVRHPAGL